MSIWNQLAYFEPDGSDNFGEPDKMSDKLLLMLDDARRRADVIFKITSGYREGDPLSHGDGDAVDIACVDGDKRFKIVSALLAVGFKRVGVYNKHIHADTSVRLPPNVMWWGTSK